MLARIFKRVIFATLVIVMTTSLVVMYRGGVQEPYHEIRAAMDIGSGTTNMKVARIDTRDNKIHAILFEQRVPIPFERSLALSKDEMFDEEIRKEGIKVLKNLKKKADDYGAKKVVAVATAAFRRAKNAQEYAKEIEKETGIDVQIVSQEQEGILGFYGALSKRPADPQDVIAWDIGGGSMQLTTLMADGKYFVDKGTKASIFFKNLVIEKAEDLNIHEVSTPNPISKSDMIKAVAFAENIALNVSPKITDKIDLDKAKIYAIGNLFYYGIRPIVDGKNSMKPYELQAAIAKLLDKDDEQLGGGSLAEVKVTNALLVLGYMDALNIKEIHFIDVNNADGALTYPGYWSTSDEHTEERQQLQ